MRCRQACFSSSLSSFFFCCSSNQNRSMLFSEARGLPLPIGQRSRRKIINTAAGLTRHNLPLPSAIFRETWAALRSDVDVGHSVCSVWTAIHSGRSGGWKERLHTTVEIFVSKGAQGCNEMLLLGPCCVSSSVAGSYNGSVQKEKLHNKSWGYLCPAGSRK